MPYKDKDKEREAKRRWYHLHKGIYRKNETARRLSKRAYLNKVKDKPCTDCGKKYPSYVMDFDHRNPEEKLYDTSRLLRYGWEALYAELAKCDVVCANCHRLRTFSSPGSSTDRADAF